MYSDDPNCYAFPKRKVPEKPKPPTIDEYDPEAEKVELAHELTKNFTKSWMKHNFI